MQGRPAPPLRGLGKLQDGKDVYGQANDPAELQFNYLPEGLREEENKPSLPARQESNFFNMEQAAMANPDTVETPADSLVSVLSIQDSVAAAPALSARYSG